MSCTLLSVVIPGTEDQERPYTDPECLSLLTMEELRRRNLHHKPLKLTKILHVGRGGDLK